VKAGNCKCRRSWDNGKARCGPKVAGIGDGGKEELDAELWRNKGVRREVIAKNGHILGLISESK
jgi:hypothetical protein